MSLKRPSVINSETIKTPINEPCEIQKYLTFQEILQTNNIFITSSKNMKQIHIILVPNKRLFFRANMAHGKLKVISNTTKDVMPVFEENM